MARMAVSLLLAAFVATAVAQFSAKELGMHQPKDDGYKTPEITENGGNVTVDCPSCGPHGRAEKIGAEHTCYCHCNIGYEGARCEKLSVCQNNCRGRGRCVLGTCRCNKGFCGEDCSETGDKCRQFSDKCQPECMNGGACITDNEMRSGFACVCKPPFQGLACEQLPCKEDCGNGFCNFDNGTCVCKEGWSGANCDQRKCGQCNDTIPCGDVCIPVGATCNSPPGCARAGFMTQPHPPSRRNISNENEVIFPPYATDDFPVEHNGSSCGAKCTEFEECINHKCVCRAGRRGPKCEVAICPNECLGQGVCRGGQCICDAGFAGPDCGRRECLNNCSGTNGFCRKISENEGVCQCKEGFTGADCNKTYCLNNCSNHGHCNMKEGVCYCFPGWSNSDCSMSVCPNQCSGNGECIQGFCKCLHGYSGAACSVRVKEKEPIDTECIGVECHGKDGICKKGVCFCHLPWVGQHCDLSLCVENCGHGKCVQGRGCVCNAGWMGLSCKQRKCPADCNGVGVCHQGQCHCDLGFMGEACEHSYCPNDCNGHGQCVNNTCVCKSGYSGAACEHMKCPGYPVDCSNNGVCTDGVCECRSGWIGEACDQERCPADCTHNGTVRGACKGGRCECFPGFEGLNCSHQSCPNDCSGHGDCLRSTCVCDKGWRSDDCGARECINDCSNNGNVTQEQPGHCREDGKCICSNRFYGIDCSIQRPQRHKCAAKCVGHCVDSDACQALYEKIQHHEDVENLQKYRECYMGCTESCNTACENGSSQWDLTALARSK